MPILIILSRHVAKGNYTFPGESPHELITGCGNYNYTGQFKQKVIW